MAGTKKQENSRPKLVGVNHIALEVGDIEEALAFYGRIFDFSLRRKEQGSGLHRHGRPVHRLDESDEGQASGRRAAFRRGGRSTAPPSGSLVKAAGGPARARPFLDFLIPWGNRVGGRGLCRYPIHKAPHVLRGMGLDLGGTKGALRELNGKGHGAVGAP